MRKKKQTHEIRVVKKPTTTTMFRRLPAAVRSIARHGRSTLAATHKTREFQTHCAKKNTKQTNKQQTNNK